MMNKRFSSWPTRSALLALMLVAACSETGKESLDVSSPKLPNLQVVVVETNWDFAALVGPASDCGELGPTETISLTGFGSIEASATGAVLTSKGRELPVNDTERGLGLDTDLAAGCQGDEVGDIAPLGAPYNGILYLNLDGVLPAGSTLTQIDLGSVQDTEGWLVSYSTTGIGGPYTLLSQGEGNGVNNPGANITLDGLSFSTDNLVLRFEKNTLASGNATTDNDYVVKAVTTSHTEETEEGCTLTQGYWKTHSALGPAPSDAAWLNIGALGQNTLFFNTGDTWYEIFHTPPSGGNAFLQLAHQYMAAKLNILNGATPTAGVTAAITAAETYFSGKAAGVTSESSNTISAQLRGYASTLGSFNEGATGPGHCDELE